MRFYCHCLNVAIHVLNIAEQTQNEIDFLPVEFVQTVNNSHEWLVAHSTNNESIQIVWPSLAQTISFREMKLSRCLNCHIYTHMNNLPSNQILINRNLFDETRAKAAQLDSNYSPITKILLPKPSSFSNSQRSPNIQDENQQTDCRIAQQMYRQALEDLEKESEEKIRSFQREQENYLANRTEKLNRELNTFLSLMRSVTRHAPITKGSPTSSSFINENSTESGFGSDIFDIGSTDFGRLPSQFDRGFSDRPSNSDDEQNDDDDEQDEINDDPMLGNRAWPTENSNPSNFATSLPKAIASRPPTAYLIPERDDTTDDLEKIGKSFRDLSRSMCTDGTELFGELPSPRLNIRYT